MTKRESLNGKPLCNKRVNKTACREIAAIVAGAVSAVFLMSSRADSTGTYVTNDVTWTWKTVDNSDGSQSYRMGGGSATSTAMPTDTELDASLIPWSCLGGDGSFHTFDMISAHAFKDCKNLTGILKIPSSIQYVGQQAFVRTGITRAIVNATRNGIEVSGSHMFFGCENLKGVWYKGHGGIWIEQHFYGASALKLVVFGPQIDKRGSFGASFFNVKGCKIFYSASQTSWDSGTEGDWYCQNGNEVIRYGAGQDFDMTFSDTEDSVTIYPKTETAVTNAIAWAPLFKDALGLDMKIAITNRIEMSEDIEITEAMLQNVTVSAPPWYLTFAVKSQTQLDNVLDSISVDTPIIIDIEGVGKNQITVPKGRKVAILAKDGWTFGQKTYGIVISFR